MLTLTPPTHPKAVVEKAVDDWIDEAVGHGEPVYAVVERNEEAFLCGCFVVCQLRVEVNDEHERVQRQPTDGEQYHDDYKHLCYLSINQSNTLINSIHLVTSRAVTHGATVRTLRTLFPDNVRTVRLRNFAVR